jgi:hypothetical protein
LCLDRPLIQQFEDAAIRGVEVVRIALARGGDANQDALDILHGIFPRVLLGLGSRRRQERGPRKEQQHHDPRAGARHVS